MEKYKFYKRETGYEEIDLSKLMIYVLKKWRIIIAWVIIGAILGTPIGYYKASRPLVAVDKLSPGIKANLDSFKNQANVNEQANIDELGNYILQLEDTDTYYNTTIQYTIRTDQHEDVELAASYLDLTQEPGYLEELATITGYDGYIGNLIGIVGYTSIISNANEIQGGTTYIGGSSQQSKDTNNVPNIPEDATPEEIISTLQEALETASSSQDIADIFSSLNKTPQAYAKISYTIKYLTKDQTNKFVDWLTNEMELSACQYCQDYSGFKLRYINRSTIAMQPSEVKNAKQMIHSQIAKRTAEVETAVASYLATISTTSTVNGVTTAAIISNEEKEQYKEYWSSISNSEYKDEFRIFEMCKLIFISIVLFAFMAFLYYSMKYVLSNKRVYEDDIRNEYNIPIVGYVADGKRRYNGLDKKLLATQNMMQPCGWRYIAELLRKNNNECVLVHSSFERSIQPLIEVASEIGVEFTEGNILNDKNIVMKACEIGSVYIVVETGITTMGVLEAELHTIEMYGLVLNGIILV